jgi:hypothetical protein
MFNPNMTESLPLLYVLGVMGVIAWGHRPDILTGFHDFTWSFQAYMRYYINFLQSRPNKLYIIFHSLEAFSTFSCVMLFALLRELCHLLAVM